MSRLQLNEEQLKVLAYHEAGHAVACVVLNITMKKKVAVTIVPDHDSDGSVRHYGGWTKQRSMSTIAMCGPVAEIVLAGGNTSFGDSDLEKFERHAALLLDCNPDEVRAHPRYAELERAEVIIASALLVERWDAVQAVATALLEKKTLTRDEVFDLVINNLKRSKKLVLTPVEHQQGIKVAA
jgi:ATP-dependent Zn protease